LEDPDRRGGPLHLEFKVVLGDFKKTMQFSYLLKENSKPLAAFAADSCQSNAQMVGN